MELMYSQIRSSSEFIGEDLSATIDVSGTTNVSTTTDVVSGDVVSGGIDRNIITSKLWLKP